MSRNRSMWTEGTPIASRDAFKRSESPIVLARRMWLRGLWTGSAVVIAMWVILGR